MVARLPAVAQGSRANGAGRAKQKAKTLINLRYSATYAMTPQVAVMIGGAPSWHLATVVYAEELRRYLMSPRLRPEEQPEPMAARSAMLPPLRRELIGRDTKRRAER
jgi:hypothetical protein